MDRHQIARIRGGGAFSVLAFLLAGQLEAATLEFTTPLWGADPDSCEVPWPGQVQNLVTLRAWRALCGSSGMPVLVRSRTPGTAGAGDTLEVPGDCATWWVTFVNARGLESCLGRGYTVGIPPVGVEPGAPDDASEEGGAADARSLFDLRGALVSTPIRDLPNGIYFRRVGSSTFRIVVRNGAVVGTRKIFPRRKAQPL